VQDGCAFALLVFLNPLKNKAFRQSNLLEPEND
jgi:hypothetical protein